LKKEIKLYLISHHYVIYWPCYFVFTLKDAEIC